MLKQNLRHKANNSCNIINQCAEILFCSTEFKEFFQKFSLVLHPVFGILPNFRHSALLN